MLESLENLINNIINTLYTDPIYLVIAVILSGLLIFSLVKKLIKIAIYVSAVAIIYLGYLYFTNTPMEDIKDQVEDTLKVGQQIIEDGMDKIIPEKDGK
jgi:hypothetical protein